jgi:hypothetical protein
MWALASNLQQNVEIRRLTVFSTTKFCIRVPSFCFLDKLSSYFDLLYSAVHCPHASSTPHHHLPNTGTFFFQTSSCSRLHLESVHSWNNEYQGVRKTKWWVTGGRKTTSTDTLAPPRGKYSKSWDREGVSIPWASSESKDWGCVLTEADEVEAETISWPFLATIESNTWWWTIRQKWVRN